MDEWEQFWWFCNSDCRVIEFYASDETETVCPSCGRKGDTESQ